MKVGSDAHDERRFGSWIAVLALVCPARAGWLGRRGAIAGRERPRRRRADAHAAEKPAQPKHDPAREPSRRASMPGRSKRAGSYRVSLGPWSRQIFGAGIARSARRRRSGPGFLRDVRDPGSRRLSFGQPPRDLAAGRLLGARLAVGVRAAGVASAGGRRVAAPRAATASSRSWTVPSRGPRSSSARRSSIAKGPAGFVFAFRVLPTVIFVAALFAVLYHLGVMQWVVRGFAVVMARLMGTSGAESLNVAASLFLGQTEAPLTIRPYLARLTRSELLTVMTSGMAHVSGGVMAAYIGYGIEARHILTAVIMTAPGAILLSKILVPETDKPETLGTVGKAEAHDRRQRARRGGARHPRRPSPGAQYRRHADLVPGLGRSWSTLGLGYLGTSLQGIVGWVMAPVAYMLGVPWEDCKAVGKLLGTRTVLNELIAFSDLGELKSQVS